MNKKILTILFLLFLFLGTKSAHAKIASSSAEIQNSRPSVSTSLDSDLPEKSTKATFLDSNSPFLASDSAVIKNKNGLIENIFISSVSANTVFLSGKTTVPHYKEEALFHAVLNTHLVKFTNQKNIPPNGKITIDYPILSSADSNSSSSPSASTFQMNSLNSSLIKITSGSEDITSNFSSIIAANPEGNGSFPQISLGLNNSASISANSNLYIFLGCKKINGSNCIEQSPTIINPTKKSEAGNWKITVSTKDQNNKILETGDIWIKTTEPLVVKAFVEEKFTFSISGIKDKIPVNANNEKGCRNEEIANTGFDSDSSNVNLGKLSDSKISISAQRIAITANTKTGYILTATSSGQLKDIKSGLYLPSSKIPKPMQKGRAWFGIHPCGADVDSKWWTINAGDPTGNGTGAKYGWPESAGPLIISSAKEGPVFYSLNKKGITSIEYASTIDSKIKAGEYTTSITYTASPTF